MLPVRPNASRFKEQGVYPTFRVWTKETLSTPLIWDTLEKMGARWSGLVSKISLRKQSKSDNQQRADFYMDRTGPSRDRIVLERLFRKKLVDLTGWKIRRYDPRQEKGSNHVHHRNTSRAQKVEKAPVGSDFLIWSWNINGLTSKKSLVDDWIDRFEPACLLLQETNKGIGSWPLMVSDYSSLVSHADKTIPGARGLAICVSNGYKICPYGAPSPYWLFGKVFGGTLDQSVIVGSVYLPTKSRQKGLRQRVLLDLKVQLEWIQTHSSEPVFIGGDFNMNAKEMHAYLRRHLLDFRRLAVEGSKGTFNRPGRRQTDIDHLLVSVKHAVHCKKAVVMDGVIGSDHYPLSAGVLGLDGKPKVVSRGSEYTKMDINKVKKNQLVILDHNHWTPLANSHWVSEEGDVVLKDLYSVEPVVGPEDEIDSVRLEGNELPASSVTTEWAAIQADVDAFNTSFVKDAHRVAKSLDLHQKLNTAVKKFKLHLQSRTLREIARRVAKENAWSQAVRAKKSPKAIDKLREEFLAAKKRASKLAQSDRKEYWLTTVKHITEKTGGGGSKPYWRWVKSILDIRPRSNATGADPIQDPLTKELLTDIEDIRKAWLVHYKTLASDTDGKSKDPKYWEDLHAGIKSLEEIGNINRNLTWTEVCEVMLVMQQGKAPGDDKLPLELLRACITRDLEGHLDPMPSGAMAIRLWELLKKVWDTEVLPKDWLNSTVVSIPKKGDLTIMDNYRGISLMPIASKLLYTIINRRINEGLEAADVFVKEQAGFRKGEECVGQATALYEAAKRRENAGLPTYMCFVDMQKAFDTVPHEAMLLKLMKSGIQGKVLNLVRKIYDGSVFRVRGGFGFTDEIQLMRGVRQGCPLSPTLFNVFINDLLNDNKAAGLGIEIPGIEGARISGFLFADDLCLMADTEEGMRQLLANTSKWADTWGMKFGIKKCAVVGIGLDVEEVRKVEWLLQGQRVPVDTMYTYLGLDFHSDLCLGKMAKKRLQIAASNAHRIRYFFTCWNIPISARVMVLKACIIPQLLYGGELWGMNASLSRKHETLVNTCLRWIIGSSGAGVSVASMREEFNIPGIAASAAGRRARAALVWPEKRTWIADLTTTPVKSRKWTWSSGTVRWCTKYGPDGSRTVPLAPSATTPPGIDDPLRGRKRKSALGRGVEQTVRERTWSSDKTEHFAWYKKYILRNPLHRDWQWLGRKVPSISRQLTILAKARVGAIPMAPLLAKWGKIDSKFHGICPFCHEEVPESLAHLVIDCEAWNGQRNQTGVDSLLNEADEIMHELGMEEDLDGKLGLLLGGRCGPARGGMQLEEWCPDSCQRRSGLLTAPELENFGGVRMARFLNLVYLARNNRLRHHKEEDDLDSDVEPGAKRYRVGQDEHCLQPVHLLDLFHSVS